MGIDGSAMLASLSARWRTLPCRLTEEETASGKLARPCVSGRF
jgi:hypothetical protein